VASENNFSILVVLLLCGHPGDGILQPGKSNGNTGDVGNLRVTRYSGGTVGAWRMNRQPFQRRDRCVTCAAPKDQHQAESLICVGSAGRAGKQYGTLDLPEGKTCGDCVHIDRCQAMFGHIPEDQTCDWYPARFQGKVTQ
jgi:hypothetical protein